VFGILGNLHQSTGLSKKKKYAIEVAFALDVEN
jgi:hypothetical protein